MDGDRWQSFAWHVGCRRKTECGAGGDHGTREVVAKARQCGDKTSEIPVVRELLKDSGLEKQKVSLDAHHFNPATTAQIHQAGGLYLTQAKENQATFLQQCKVLRTQFRHLPKQLGMKKRMVVSPPAKPKCSPWHR